MRLSKAVNRKAVLKDTKSKHICKYCEVSWYLLKFILSES